MSGFMTPGGAADFGWFAYTPLRNAIHSPGVGADLWIIGLIIGGLGTILGAVNMITTVVCLRAPGMTMFRMPIFTWNILVTSVLVLLAFPILTAALFGLLADRHLGAHVFDPANGGVILWQHLFWFFGHPEVYIVALPFFGIVSEIFPVFSRKPIFGYNGLVYATLGIAALSVAVWAHHMYATGAVLLPFFAFMTFLIAVPTGVKFFNWIGTMWKGQLTFETPMLFSIGFIVTFLFGGLSGILLAAPAIDFHVSDTYFVVAHFHYVLYGTIVFATFAGIYFWFPKITGRFMDEPLGKLHFWTTFLGFHATFLVQHWLGNEGMPRRYADYLASDGFTTLNTISTIGAYILGASTLPFIWNVFKTLPLRRDRHRRRPVGLRQLARVGDVVPAAAAQLHRAAPDPFRAPGVRAALPAHGRAHPQRGSRRPSPARRSPTRTPRPRRRRSLRPRSGTASEKDDPTRQVTCAEVQRRAPAARGRGSPRPTRRRRRENARADHRDRSRQAGCLLGAVRRADQARRRDARRRAGRDPGPAGARRRWSSTDHDPEGLQETVEQAMATVVDARRDRDRRRLEAHRAPGVDRTC